MKRIANQLKSWKGQSLILMLLLFCQFSFAQESATSCDEGIVVTDNLTYWDNFSEEGNPAWETTNSSEITFSSFLTNSNKDVNFISPEIKTEKGRKYILTFSFKGNKTGSKFHTFLCSSHDGSKDRVKLEDYIISDTDSLYTREVVLPVASNSDYRIGFACQDSEANSNLVISDVNIVSYESPEEEIVPAIKSEPIIKDYSAITPVTKKTTKTPTAKADNKKPAQEIKPTSKQDEKEKAAKEETPKEEKATEVAKDSVTSTTDSIASTITEDAIYDSVAPEEPQTKQKFDYGSNTLLYIILGSIILVLAIIAAYLRKKNKENSETIADLQLQINNKENAARIMREQEKVVVPAPQKEPKVVIPANFKLTNYASELATINSFHSKLLTHLQELIDDTSNLQQRKALVALKNEISDYSDTLLSKEFSHNFSVIHPEFFNKLSKRFPQLNKSDLTLCAYLYLGISTKEIASLTDREVRSVESARNRLRKKINLEAGEDFCTYFAEIENS